MGNDMMSTELAAQVYCETIGFLEGRGRISHLNNFLAKECADDRMTWIDVPSCGVQLIQIYT
jgi:hypothetical protein